METGVLTIGNPVDCQVIERLNRFVVAVEIEGSSYRAYINNTGRLHEFLVRGRKGFCIKKEKAGKTDYRLFAIEEGSLGALIDTQLQMVAFEKSLERQLLPWLKGYSLIKRNARSGNSLIDYLLECNGEQLYLEVKSAVLRGNHYAMYPDCPSSRGRKHIRELTHCVKQGVRSAILFIAALPRVKAFKPNRSADRELYELLVEAGRAGVMVKSIGMFYEPESSALYLFNPDLEVDL